MKRRLLLIPLAVLVLGGVALWLAGRAPADYVLKQECRRFHRERTERYRTLTWEIGRKERAQQEGADVTAELARLRGEREELLAESRTRRIRGWEVVFLPPGTRRPSAGGFLVAARIDPSTTKEPSPLRGEIEAWIAPRGGLARLLHRWGLTP